jgi:hypothetical protein
MSAESELWKAGNAGPRILLILFSKDAGRMII